MNKCYQVLLVSSVCLLLAVPATAADMAKVEIPEASLHPLGGSGPLACCETVVYSCINGGTFSLSGTPRWNMMDDGAFPAGTAPVDVYCIRFAFDHGVTEPLYIAVEFWDTLVPGGPVCNLSWIGGVVLDLGTVTAGSYWTEVVLASPITIPDDDWAVEMSYWQSVAPWVTSTNSSVIFAEGPPTVGSNDADVFYWDYDGSDSFECPDEAVSFGSGDDQFYLQLGTDVGPSATETNSWGSIKALYR